MRLILEVLRYYKILWILEPKCWHFNFTNPSQIRQTSWQYLFLMQALKYQSNKDVWISNFLRLYDETSPYIYIYTVDSRYLAPVGSQNSRARVKWFSRYLALSREGHDSRIQDHRSTLPSVYNSQTVCWAIIEVLTFPGSLHTSTSHQRQITTSDIRF